MKFHINTITPRTEKANMVSLSFIDVKGIPEGFSFSIFMPKSIQLEEGKDCEVPFYIAKNIWHGSFQYIFKDLVKAAKKSVHKRAEKPLAAKAAVEAFMDAEKLNVEETYPEVGEHFGTAGDEAILALTIDRCLFTNQGCYTGIWRHNGHGWEHPGFEKSTWRAIDQEGHIFIFTSSNDEFNGHIYEACKAKKPILLNAKIIGHNIFRGEKQTKLQVRKQEIKYMEEAE